MLRLVLVCLLTPVLLTGCMAKEPTTFHEESSFFFVIATPDHHLHDYILCIPEITLTPECLSGITSGGG
jgi:hypothetical protein